MILLIDNYDSFTFNLYQAISACNDDVKVVRNDKISIEEIKQLPLRGIVLSPGPGRPETAGICLDIIKAFYRSVPILGVCLGHQVIAAAFGATITHAPELVHGKKSLIFHHRGGLYRGHPLPFSAGRYHSLIIKKSSLPPVLTVESETADEVIMGIRHQQYPVFGVQFHPESVLSEHGETLINNFIQVCKEATPCLAY